MNDNFFENLYDRTISYHQIFLISLGASLKMLKSPNMLPFVIWQRVGAWQPSSFWMDLELMIDAKKIREYE